MSEPFELNALEVASPCNANWDDMVGDDKVRHCAQCQLNVYNFSEMTAPEVRQLVEQTEGRLCGRMYRREDGTLLTRNCPKGLQAVRAKALKVASLIAGTVIGLFATVGISNASDKVPCAPPTQVEPASPSQMGGIAPAQQNPETDPHIMGEIVVPENQPPQTVAPPQGHVPVSPDMGGVVMGKIQAPQQKTPH